MDVCWVVLCCALLRFDIHVSGLDLGTIGLALLGLLMLNVKDHEMLQTADVVVLV